MKHIKYFKPYRSRSGRWFLIANPDIQELKDAAEVQTKTCKDIRLMCKYLNQAIGFAFERFKKTKELGEAKLPWKGGKNEKTVQKTKSKKSKAS